MSRRKVLERPYAGECYVAALRVATTYLESWKQALPAGVAERLAESGPWTGGLRSPRAVADVLRALIGDSDRERFWAMALDSKHKVIAAYEVSVGTLTTSLVHPREVYATALRMGAAALVVAHNHPSGDPEPSVEDVAVTQRLSDAGRLLGVPLLDHVVVGDGRRTYSLREHGQGGIA